MRRSPSSPYTNPENAMSFFTIGHSTRTISEFVELLQRNGVEKLIDVRSTPFSRRVPQFNNDTIGSSLASYQIGYEHIPELGGRRSKGCCEDHSQNGFWTHKSFRNYADYALTADFERGLKRLRDLGESRVIAYMCAEAVWWKCHRRIITDHLLARDIAVKHIMGPDVVNDAKLNSGALIRPNKQVVYPSTDAVLI
jgi:uncharacterized protein (DUF488 family)